VDEFLFPKALISLIYSSYNPNLEPRSQLSSKNTFIQKLKEALKITKNKKDRYTVWKAY